MFQNWGWLKFNNRSYWDTRYARGGDSGAGSKGKLAQYKAQIINNFISQNQLTTIAELGCGDGLQLEWADYPQYTGYDISEVAIQKCSIKFKRDSTKQFKVIENPKALQYYEINYDLALSLDVLYHIIDEQEFETYLKNLFALSNRYIIIYAPDHGQDKETSAHVLYRPFTEFINTVFPNWKLIEHIKNKYSEFDANGHSSDSDFFIYGQQIIPL